MKTWQLVVATMVAASTINAAAWFPDGAPPLSLHADAVSATPARYATSNDLLELRAIRFMRVQSTCNEKCTA
jgi:hypothetical protein